MPAEDERRAAFACVECGLCGAAVLAAKFSPQHTSVQWTAAAVRSCWEFSAASRPSALVEGCGSLRDSIDGAVASGRLEVSPP
ncbi:MAG TPA: ferredoxin [Streptosporangiaceae bacterium]|nr:ferredoxin [Streptosporangiaceae bacterium]